MRKSDPSARQNQKVYGCPNPYTADTRTHSKNSRNNDTSGDSELIIVVSTPIGTIALTKEELSTARTRAASLLNDPMSTPKDDQVSRPTTLLDARAIAELFDMDPTWFLTRAREDRIPHIQFGKYVRFNPTEIRAFFERNPDRHADLKETHPQQDSDSKR